MTTVVIPYIAEIPFQLPDTLQVNDDFPVTMPYDGEILNYHGSIAVLGTGAGTSTDVQVSNDNTGIAYFATKPTFEVNSATNLLEGGVLIDSPTFKQGQVVRLLVTAIATAPKDAVIYLVCKFFKRNDV